MRERLARRIAFLTGALVVTLAVLFARSQNPPGVPKPLPPETTTAAPALRAPAASAQVARGEQLYLDLGCARCHSIAGRGNPRLPLDGVGSRSSETEIRAWIAPGVSPPGSYQQRHADLGLSPEQVDALAAYLLALKE